MARRGVGTAQDRHGAFLGNGNAQHLCGYRHVNGRQSPCGEGQPLPGLEGRTGEEIDGFIRDWATECVGDSGASYGEAFRKITFRT